MQQSLRYCARQLAALLCFALAHSATLALDNTEPGQRLDFAPACEQPHADLIGGKQTRKTSAPRSRPDHPLTQPPYPRAARVMGADGVVVVNLLIAEDGTVSRAVVHRSSGADLLDTAALEATRHWRLRPGQVDGKPVCMWGRFAITFSLDTYSPAELRTARVTDDARDLARMMLLVDEVIDTSLDNAKTLDRSEVRLRRTVIQGLREQPAWQNTHDHIARVLTLSFTRKEIEQLAAFHRTPVARKMRAVTGRLAPEMAKSANQLHSHLRCANALLVDA